MDVYQAIDLDEEIPLYAHEEILLYAPIQFRKKRSHGSKQRSHGSKRILERLLLKYESICHLCDQYVEPRLASADHIIPRGKGGRNAFDNLALAHKSCNHNRGSLSVEKYRKFYQYRMEHGHWPAEYKESQRIKDRKRDF